MANRSHNTFDAQMARTISSIKTLLICVAANLHKQIPAPSKQADFLLNNI